MEYGRVFDSRPSHINRERLSGHFNIMWHQLLKGLLMEHQKRNYLELGIDSLKDKDACVILYLYNYTCIPVPALRYLCYFIKFFN